MRDTELRGFGVRRQGSTLSYFLQRKVHGNLRWVTIGMHGSPWTAENARREALRLLAELNSGGDPVRRRKEECEKPTVAEACEQFTSSHGRKLKPRTYEEYQRLIRLHILPALGSRFAVDIAKSDVVRFQASLADKLAMANFSLAVLSKLMRWCEVPMSTKAGTTMPLQNSLSGKLASKSKSR